MYLIHKNVNCKNNTFKAQNKWQENQTPRDREFCLDTVKYKYKLQYLYCLYLIGNNLECVVARKKITVQSKVSLSPPRTPWLCYIM